MHDVFFLHVKQSGCCDRLQVSSSYRLGGLPLDGLIVDDVAFEQRLPGLQLFVWIQDIHGIYKAKTRSRNEAGYEDLRSDPFGTGHTVLGSLLDLGEKLEAAPKPHLPTLQFVQSLAAFFPDPAIDFGSIRR